ncbi:hypothetical protein CA54_46090 [Symmachiella macrocystis]|uniref:Uncharacterized protein n=2 Tax=Symmachiella macrocystis TaxID=2527985 RepID=A0A5C6BBK8_9PLAN|nr:hypothetical protein CA54_46090 [Symmachiella macrocystis]
MGISFAVGIVISGSSDCEAIGVPQAQGGAIRRSFESEPSRFRQVQIAASYWLRRSRLRCNRGYLVVFPYDLRKLRWHFLAATCYDVTMIQSNSPIPELTDEQQQALKEGNGVVQGESYLLMRHDVLLDWFGYTPDQLRVELQPAIEQADRGELEEWNLQEFLKDVRRPGDAKSE